MAADRTERAADEGVVKENRRDRTDEAGWRPGHRGGECPYRDGPCFPLSWKNSGGRGSGLHWS